MDRRRRSAIAILIFVEHHWKVSKSVTAVTGLSLMRMICLPSHGPGSLDPQQIDPEINKDGHSAFDVVPTGH